MRRETYFPTLRLTIAKAYKAFAKFNRVNVNGERRSSITLFYETVYKDKWNSHSETREKWAMKHSQRLMTRSYYMFVHGTSEEGQTSCYQRILPEIGETKIARYKNMAKLWLVLKWLFELQTPDRINESTKFKPCKNKNLMNFYVAQKWKWVKKKTKIQNARQCLKNNPTRDRDEFSRI